MQPLTDLVDFGLKSSRAEDAPPGAPGARTCWGPLHGVRGRACGRSDTAGALGAATRWRLCACGAMATAVDAATSACGVPLRSMRAATSRVSREASSSRSSRAFSSSTCTVPT